MATRIIDDSKLNDIAVAIQAKDSGGQMTVDEMPTRIANIPTGGGAKTQKVNFYDFKGNLAHSYTAEEAAAKTAAEPLPHEKVLGEAEDDPDAPAPEVTEQDVIDHKAGEKAASDEGGFRVSRERSGEEGNNQNRRRRAVQTRERTEDGE